MGALPRIPPTAQLIPLAALAAQFDLEGSRQELEAWLWGSSFTSSYDVASSTVAKEDYDLLTGVLAGTRAPRTYTLPVETIEHAYRRTSGSLWRAFRLFLAWHGARDFITGKSLAASNEDDLAMESVLPRVKQPGNSTPLYQLTLAQVLVDKSSVAKMRRRPIGLRSVDEIDDSVLKLQLLGSLVFDDLVIQPMDVVRLRANNLMDALTTNYPGAFER